MCHEALFSTVFQCKQKSVNYVCSDQYPKELDGETIGGIPVDPFSKPVDNAKEGKIELGDTIAAPTHDSMYETKERLTISTVIVDTVGTMRGVSAREKLVYYCEGILTSFCNFYSIFCLSQNGRSGIILVVTNSSRIQEDNHASQTQQYFDWLFSQRR